MVLLQVETTDVLTPVVALASSFIAAIVTLTVAMLRFGLGRGENPSSSSVTKADLLQCTKDVSDLLLPELGAIRREMTENGKILAEIRGRMHNPGEERK